MRVRECVSVCAFVRRVAPRVNVPLSEVVRTVLIRSFVHEMREFGCAF